VAGVGSIPAPATFFFRSLWWQSCIGQLRQALKRLLVSNLDEGRVKDAIGLAKTAAKNFSKNASTGRKIAAASIVAGAGVSGVKRARKVWKQQKDKKGRVGKTAKAAAKGAFSGAISGAITGYGVGNAVDYIRGESIIEDAVYEVLNGASLDDVVEATLARANTSGLLKRAKLRLPARATTSFGIAAASAAAKKGIRPSGLLRGLFGGRRKKVERYRLELWRRHKTEIFRESRQALNSAMKHMSELNEWLEEVGRRLALFSPPSSAVKSLTRALIKDKDKILVNSRHPGSDWSNFEFENWAIYIYQEAALWKYNHRIDFVEALKTLIAIGYEDFVYNKYEDDKSKYVYDAA